MAFSLDGRLAPSGVPNLAVRLWEVETGKEVQRFEAAAGDVWAVAFSPDGRRILTSGTDKAVRLWDVASDAPCCASTAVTRPG